MRLTSNLLAYYLYRSIWVINNKDKLAHIRKLSIVLDPTWAGIIRTAVRVRLNQLKE